MPQQPPFATLPARELYCPSHFGNTYEATLSGEMSDRLAEARFWGFNRYSDWFDTIDLYDLYARNQRFYNMPEAVWERKFGNYTCAAREGFGLGLVVTPNHVFADQVTGDNAAQAGAHFFGQLVCPSKSGVVDMILENYQRLFRDFTERGLRLSAISGGAYDYGGCACDACRPWIVTFGTLFHRIARLAREVFGPVEAELWGWWWTDEDHEQFTRWADARVPGFFDSLAYHLPYGKTEYEARPIPRGCSEKAFVHIAYGERSSRDSYSHYGANIAPVRLWKTVEALVARGAAGFLAYSEGDHDDINKAILGGLSSGRFRTTREILEAYAERYFGTDSEGWSDLLHRLGDFETIDAPDCRERFDRLAAGARDTWRLRQVEGRLKLAEAHQAVLAESEWTPARIAAANAYRQAKEELYRNVWRLGIQRHIFRFEGNLPEWYGEFAELEGHPPTGAIQDLLGEA